jgi:predicted nucleic acid-binding protein
MAFLDTSALGKCYAREAGSERVRALTEQGGAALVLLGRITIVECVAAFAGRAKQGSFSLEERDAALRSFENDLRRRYLVIECDAEVVRVACGLALRHALRGYDAVQLASALRAWTLCSPLERTQFLFLCADERLGAAATSEGLVTRNPAET